MPRLSLTVLYVNPVARCATVMDAPATTPAEASVTLPDKEADATCARAAPATQRKTMSAFMTCCPGRKLTIYPRKKRYRVFQPGIVQPIGGKTAELANRLFPNPVPIFAVAGGILKQLPGNFRGVGRFERGPGAGPALQRHQGAHGAPVSGPNFRKLGQGHFERQLPVRPDPRGASGRNRARWGRPMAALSLSGSSEVASSDTNVHPARAHANDSVLFPAPDAPHSRIPEPSLATQAACTGTVSRCASRR